jgi:hypothetical protein
MECNKLQLDQVNLRKVGRTSTEYCPALPIKCLVFIADPDMFAESLCPVDLVIADTDVITRNPNHGPFSTESLVLESALY